MSEKYYAVELQEIINDFNSNKFEIVIKKLNLLSINHPEDKIINRLFASTYFKITNWKKAIEYYEKTLFFEKDKFKIYNNIGFAYFKLGQIENSINSFKKSIKENPSYFPTYNNLAISYNEIGRYNEVIQNFISALELNKKNIIAENGLINIFNFIKPKNTDDHPLIEINKRINEISKKLKIESLDEIKNIERIFSESENIIEELYGNISFRETQIYRKNKKNLNCKRHFQIFNKFNIIPKFCFSCYKVQINLNNVVDLIKLFFIFDYLHLEKNNTRKCIIEMRDKIKGNYKGYIYCSGLNEAQKILDKLNKIITNSGIVDFEILIKHGCSEFYESYPKFEKINFKGSQEMQYRESWQVKENIIDKENPARLENDKKVFNETLRGLNLSDILIIKNWINYADVIGDHSYKLIYKKKVKENFIKSFLQPQLNFRISQFLKLKN